MQDLSVRDIKVGIASIVWFFRNWPTFIQVCRSNGEEKIRTKEWAAERQTEPTGVEWNATISEPYSESENNDVYVPSHSVVAVQGDGYNFSFENNSDWDKTISYAVRHRADSKSHPLVPPLFDEGEDNG